MEHGDFGSLQLAAPGDIPRARALAGRAMDAIGCSTLTKTRFVTAVSEIARNTLVHGGGGTARFEIRQFRNSLMVVAEFADEGPGIEDVDRALTDGYTSGGGMGLGLGGAKRLTDLFEIEKRSPSGVVVRIGSHKR